MAFSEKRVERMASATVMPTSKELESAIADAKNGTMFNYQREVPVFVRSVAERAEAAGRLVCANEGCELACSGVNLRQTETPSSEVEAALIARCPVSSCMDQGVQAAAGIFRYALGLGGE